MHEPSEKEIKRLQRKYYEIIADLQAQCVGDIQEVRRYVYSKLAELEDKKTSYAAITTYIITKYMNMFVGIKKDVLETYNKAAVFEKAIVEQTLGQSIPYKAVTVNVLPSTKAFEVTNNILRENSILKRNKVLANRVTNIILDGFENGASIQALQRKLDIEFGFRNTKGEITEKSKELIKQGRFSHRNGHIYQTYRIARTETMRMANIRTNEIFDSVKRDDKRLKLISTIDGRERYQSYIMNGQISDKQGRFKYPDGKYHRLGKQPKQWAINDRETSCVVFLDDETALALKNQNQKRFDSFEDFTKTGDNIAQQATKQRKNKDKVVEFLRKNTDKDTLRKFYEIGSLPQSCVDSLGAKTANVKFSIDNYTKNRIKHPEISADLYQQIPEIFRQPDYAFEGSNNRLRFFKTLDNNLYEMVVKTTKDKNENYLLSLHISDFSKIENLKNK